MVKAGFSTDDLAKTIFWIALIVLIIVITTKLMTALDDEQEYRLYTAKAEAARNPTQCKNIKNLQFSALCYSNFVKEGYVCSTTSVACLIAQAVYEQDEGFCDAVFPPEELPYLLECRVSFFIERYTNEGLSDCCNIK